MSVHTTVDLKIKGDQINAIVTTHAPNNKPNGQEPPTSSTREQSNSHQDRVASSLKVYTISTILLRPQLSSWLANMTNA